MICNGCGNKEALHVKICYTDKGEKIELCEKCGKAGHITIPDVYYPGHPYFDENLADKDHRKGQMVNSKAHKAALLKKLNLVEAGDIKNPLTGKVTPYFKDPEKRRRWCAENFG